MGGTFCFLEIVKLPLKII